MERRKERGSKSRKERDSEKYSERERERTLCVVPEFIIVASQRK